MSEDLTFKAMTNAILVIGCMLQTDLLLLFPLKYWDKKGNLKKTESTAAWMSIYNHFSMPWKDRVLWDKGERYTDSLSPRSIANDNADVSLLSGDHTEASVDYNSLDLSENSNQDHHQHPTTCNRHSTPFPPSSGDNAASADDLEDNQTSNNDSNNNDNV